MRFEDNGIKEQCKLTCDISVGFQTRHSYVSTGMTVILSYKEYVVIVDELFGHVHWYLFRGFLVTSAVERPVRVAVWPRGPIRSGLGC